MADEEAGRLASRYAPGSEWYKANETDREAMENRARIGERMLRAAAENTHRAAQQARQEYMADQTPEKKAHYVELYRKAGDLYALFGPESTGIDTWAGADDLARQVGGNGGFPDLPLEITAPGEESGTYDSFIEILGFEDIAIEQGVPEDEAASLRSDYQASPNDNVIITAMEGSPSALGFVGFAFAEEAGDAIKEIEVDGGDGCVAPTVESIGDGSYPISRSLYIYVNDESAKRPEVAAFVDHYLSDDSLNGLVSEVGYIPLPAERIDATRSAWESATA